MAVMVSWIVPTKRSRERDRVFQRQLSKRFWQAECYNDERFQVYRYLKQNTYNGSQERIDEQHPAGGRDNQKNVDWNQQCAKVGRFEILNLPQCENRLSLHESSVYMCTIGMMYGHEVLQSVSIVSIELAAFNWYMATLLVTETPLNVERFWRFRWLIPKRTFLYSLSLYQIILTFPIFKQPIAPARSPLQNTTLSQLSSKIQSFPTHRISSNVLHHPPSPPITHHPEPATYILHRPQTLRYHPICSNASLFHRTHHQTTTTH